MLATCKLYTSYYQVIQYMYIFEIRKSLVEKVDIYLNAAYQLWEYEN